MEDPVFQHKLPESDITEVGVDKAVPPTPGMHHQTGFANLSSRNMTLMDVFELLARRWKLVVAGPLGVGLFALGMAFVVPPTYTAKSVFVPPQQQQGLAATAIASLGALSGLAGNVAGLETPADQYVGLMQSVTVADHLIDRFDLMKVYDSKFRADARDTLADRTRIYVGKKDGLITVEVDDHSPKLAAAMANQYVDELRAMTETIAVSEAQQRRKFFEQQLQKTKQNLIAAQLALQSSGVSEATIKTNPEAAADAYAALREQATAAEVRLQTLRHSLAEAAPEVQQQEALLASLKRQLAALALPDPASGGPDYVSKYREFKYQEALFEIFAKQYELARSDESREGALVQVIDRAEPPEKKSRPKRALIAVLAAIGSFLLLAVVLTAQETLRRAKATRISPSLMA